MPRSKTPDRSIEIEPRSFAILRLRASLGRAGLRSSVWIPRKKERIGNFKNAGSSWSQEAQALNVHDFWSDAAGRASPYGIDDVQRHEGVVYVGLSADTPEFAVEAISRWWSDPGQAVYGGGPSC